MSEPTESTPDTTAPETTDETAVAAQLVAVADLESTEVTTEQLVTVVDNLIEAGITGEAATELALSDKVLAALSPEQAQAVFAAIPVSSLTTQQVAQMCTSMTAAPTEIKATFEEAIDIYGEGFDTYVPVDSVVPVSERRSLIAAMTAITTLVTTIAAGGAGTMLTGSTTSDSDRT